MGAELRRLDSLCDELFPAEEARIVALPVERLDIGNEGPDGRLRMDGLSELTRVLLAKLGDAI